MKEDFLNKIVPLAVNDSLTSHVPPEVTVGQAIQESGWGTSKLAVAANNYFGIKADRRWGGDTYNLPGWEMIEGKILKEMMTWRKYRSIKDSIEDHSRFLKQTRYLKAYKTSTWKEFLVAIKEAGYATDPNYVSAISSIILTYGISQRCKQYRENNEHS